ncbi:MAG: O-antigen ligase family protein [Patescibacteria group bacterium]
MDKTKIIKFANKKLAFLYFVLFPFGILAKYIIDVIPFISLFLVDLKVLFKNRYFLSFLIISFFSFLTSLNFFTFGKSLGGLNYLLRLISYISFSFFIYTNYKTAGKQKLLLKSLLMAGIFIGILGIVQYLFLPDIRPLKEFGWDDHLGRLVSTFLDPAFTGILLVLSILLAVYSGNIALGFLLLLPLALTYSRSSYLALIVSFLFYFFLGKRKKILLIFPLLILLSLPFLPHPPGEGTNLARSNSVVGKFEDYQSGFLLVSKSPVFGLGFNNICQAKVKFLGETNPFSHSCGGLDSSIMFTIATVGIIGLIIFADFFVFIFSRGNVLLKASLIALLVHSFFTNTVYYAWIMGWFSILIPISLKEKKLR